MNKEQIFDEVYRKYADSHEYFVDGWLHVIPMEHSKETFVNECKTNPDFSEKWGLKIEERVLSLNERYELVRVNGLCPKYSFEIENGKPVPNKFSQSEWYDKYNIPTKLITITYKNKTIESYE